MGRYVDVGAVKTWYDEAGSGEPLVLLHGGIVTNETWGAQMAAFPDRFHVYAPERRGHGHTPDVEGPFSYQIMADDTIAFLEQIVGGAAHLVGWSDGGNVALLVAIQRPDLVRKIVVIGSNFDTEGMGPQLEQMAEADPDDDGFAMLKGMYAAASPDGADHWPTVFKKTAAMWPDIHISTDDLGRIAAPLLVMAGDDDMIPAEHTLELFRAVPSAELAIVPGTSHGVLMEKPELVNRIVVDFLEHDPAPTMMPVRRAHIEAH